MIGKTLGRYLILEKLGGGGMGEVYRAHDQQLDRDVALKFLPESHLEDTTVIARFTREARAASALNHPNIVTVHEIGQGGATRFIVMELVEGCTLRSLIGERPSLKLLAQVLAQVAKALTAAHAAGIVHQDIKPENIMLRADGYAKVLDFGLARLTQPVTHSLTGTTEITASGMLVGTVNYMSPEQAQGQELDNATDIFSLGTVFYEWATGRLPFVGDSPIRVLQAIVSQVPLPPSQLNSEIPTSLEALVLGMLQKHPRLRPTAAEVEAALTGRLVPALAKLPLSSSFLRSWKKAGNPPTSRAAGVRNAWQGRKLICLFSKRSKACFGVMRKRAWRASFRPSRRLGMPGLHLLIAPPDRRSPRPGRLRKSA